RPVPPEFLSFYQERIAGWLRFQSRLNENFLDFFDFAVKNFCGSGIATAGLVDFRGKMAANSAVFI
ncbi:MAG: hypothetical protein LBK13_04230, partial [Spirochaetales bacterium]|nr:hypothetical protein [Spirochaetales bacterium]